MEIHEAVGNFEALAHQARLGVLRLLIPAGRDGLAAGDISKRLDLPANSLSFHLGRLVNAGLIESRRSGRNLFYAANYAHVDELVRFLADNCCANAPDGCFPDCPTVAEPLSPGGGSVADLSGTDLITEEMIMHFHKLPGSELAKAGIVGVVTAVLLTAIMMAASKLGVSPMPKPLGLAFAETVLGRALPLPVGLLFHIVYVAFWSVVFVSLFRDNLALIKALILGGVLWVAVLLVFFPIVGWGFLGLAITPKLIVAAFVPHVLFALILWGLCRVAFKAGR